MGFLETTWWFGAWTRVDWFRGKSCLTQKIIGRLIFAVFVVGFLETTWNWNFVFSAGFVVDFLDVSFSEKKLRWDMANKRIKRKVHFRPFFWDSSFSTFMWNLMLMAFAKLTHVQCEVDVVLYSSSNQNLAQGSWIMIFKECSKPKRTLTLTASRLCWRLSYHPSCSKYIALAYSTSPSANHCSKELWIVPVPTQAAGKSMDNFVAEHQDRSRNALQKSMEAAYGAFLEELRADQAQFQSELILPLGLKG